MQGAGQNGARCAQVNMQSSLEQFAALLRNGSMLRIGAFLLQLLRVRTRLEVGCQFDLH